MSGKKSIFGGITLPEENEQIFASTYKTVLPSREEFIKILEEG